MPAAARIGDMVRQDSPHCHAPIHPPLPIPTPVPQNAIEEFALVFEENIPWHLRLHDRSRMEYLVHLIAVRKKSGP